jgi:hypothetical protein
MFERLPWKPKVPKQEQFEVEVTVTLNPHWSGPGYERKFTGTARVKQGGNVVKSWTAKRDNRKAVEKLLVKAAKDWIAIQRTLGTDFTRHKKLRF